MLDFYTVGVGFEKAFESAWKDNPDLEKTIDLKDSIGRMVVLRAGNAYLELHEYRQPEGQPLDPHNMACDQGIRHLCLDVTDIHAESERLTNAGMTFKWPPQFHERVGVWSVYGRDPEGNIVELQEIVSNGSRFSLSNSRRTIE